MDMDKALLPALLLGGLGTLVGGPLVGLGLGAAGGSLLGGILGDSNQNPNPSYPYPSYQPPAPPPPANTHGIGELGMTPSQLAMINPRTQVSQALLQQRMGR